MNIIYVKLRQREKYKYRKMLSTKELIYSQGIDTIKTSLLYNPRALLEEDAWFYVENTKSQPYAIDLFEKEYRSVDFDQLNKKEFEKIDFLFVYSNGCIFFQKITKARLAAKKKVIYLGEQYKYKSNQQDIVIKDLPDAIYDQKSDRLYFKKLEAITGIFKGIDQLYREATDDEVDDFLNNDFITLKGNYGVSEIKTANRKRIALAKMAIEKMSKSDKKRIVQYISDYCPELRSDKETFLIGNEEELKMLLFGIEERYYTTQVGGEKRLANSIISLKER